MLHHARPYTPSTITTSKDHCRKTIATSCHALFHYLDCTYHDYRVICTPHRLSEITFCFISLPRITSATLSTSHGFIMSLHYSYAEHVTACLNNVYPLCALTDTIPTLSSFSPLLALHRYVIFIHLTPPSPLLWQCRELRAVPP